MKNTHKILFFFLMMGFNLSVSAQDFILSGVIFEKGTNIRLALAEVYNQRTKLGVGSNDLGMFQIKVALGDTLLISKRNFTDQQIIIKNNQSLIAYLFRQTNQLEDVTVKGQNKKQDLNEIKQEFKNKGVYNGGKTTFLSAIFSPLNALYNLVGKDPKNARRFSRYADNEIKQSEIDVYFNTSIIKNNTSLTGDTLERYMLDCRPAYDKAQYWNSYDYIKYIKDSSKKFIDTLGKGK
jgi:hypothetical protein